jgi:acyl-CoA oxidase
MSIESILKTERSKYTLPVQKLSEFLYTPLIYRQMRAIFEAAPVHDYNPNMYNKSRLALIKDTYSYLPMMFNFFQNHPEFDKFHSHIRTYYGVLVNPHQLPGTAHVGMFLKYIELMGTDEHKSTYLQKCRNYEIVGCYAQTEIGHGSDVRSLETTATFDPKTQEWVINTPSVSAAKYWPGELSFLANYAMVFAQAIVKGKSKGVYPFLVQIKDANYDWMPGITGGDIGPKLGFHAKENGYMFLSNIRVPKSNLLNKYVEVSN